MARLIFDLDDGRRAKLEAIRASRGLRSLADALRNLIDREGGDPATATAAPAPKPAPSFSHGRSKTVTVAEKRRRVEVVAAARDRADAPKFQSRLKGEWTPPGGKKR